MEVKHNKDMWLKAAYNLSDFLSWTFEKNKELFDFVANKSPIVLEELTAHFFNLSYRKKLLNACHIDYEITDNQEDINNAFYAISLYCHSLLDDESRAWLKVRGVTDEQIEKHKIGANANYNPFTALLKSRYKKPQCFFYPPLIEIEEVKKHFKKDKMKVITFPFFDVTGNSVTNLCSRILDNDYTEVFKFFFSHGPTSLFNVNNIDLTKPFYVFEGVFDTLTAERFNIPSVALGASSISEYQMDFLKNYPNAILCLDGDVAGRGGMEKVDMKKHFLPNGYDPDDLLKEKPEYASTLADIILPFV
jgi:DNA primase